LLLVLAILSFAAPRAPRPAPGRGERRFAILIPAHDEERVIDATLGTIARVDYPPERVSVHLVADNCSDRTAEIARARGVCVHERVAADNPGKGAALNWLTQQVLAEEAGLDAVVIVDADTAVSTNFLRAMDSRLAAGARVIQALDLIDSSRPHPLVYLRALAFALICGVRPHAYAAIGATSGLYGTGMCFSTSIASRYRWDETSVTEDLDQLLMLIRDDVDVVFAPEAEIRSPMPASFSDAAPQALRWERGKLDASGRALRVANGALRRGRWGAALVAAVPAIVPPLSLLVAASALALIASVLLSAAALGWLAAASLACESAYVARGAMLARLSPRALATAALWVPGYVGWKCLVAVRVLLGRGRGEWSRTARAAAVTPTEGRVR
jgi:cellulose synthase/poly-beta-1,6-N-acetylglucosamine synthase-like glycosyltransferase